MMKTILVLYFLCAVFTGVAFCQEEIEIDSQVLSVNPDGEYIVIKVGEVDGVEMGDGLIVHRDGEKLAEAQIIEVRPEVAAAEILNAEQEIKEGDEILIVKKVKSTRPVKKEKISKSPKISKEPKKSKWSTILGSRAEVSSRAPVVTVDSRSKTSVENLKSGRIQVSQEGGVVRAEIDLDPSSVFSYALMALRETGYSVIFSNRITGVILATKPIELSIMQELLADATARIEHKLVVSLEIKNNGGAAELNVAGFKEHTQKGKQIKFPVARGSKYYSDMVELASKIKERAGF